MENVISLRSMTFFQYKSVLKHADLITAYALGGASAVAYRSDYDIWQLRQPS